MRTSHGIRPTVLLIATLDTKSEEALYLKERLEELHCSVLLMNTGVLAPYAGPVDFDAAQVALAGGTNLLELQASRDKGRCIAAMRDGVHALACSLHTAGRFTGVISIGGAQGTEIGTSAMRGLPFGVPKLMVSTVASGRATFGTYVDTRDLMLMHSVADIQGLNIITRRVLDNAAAAMCGMCIALADARAPARRGAAVRCGLHARHHDSRRAAGEIDTGEAWLRVRGLPPERHRRNCNGRHDRGGPVRGGHGPEPARDR